MTTLAENRTRTLKGFLADHPVTMTTEWADRNPHMDDMPAGSSHWKCVLVSKADGRRRLTVYFSQGPAISREPSVEDLLDCLASDAATWENAQDFEDWARDLGYDPDSRKAERIYRAVEKQAKGLKRLLGDDAYDSLLWQVERL